MQARHLAALQQEKEGLRSELWYLRGHLDAARTEARSEDELRRDISEAAATAAKPHGVSLTSPCSSCGGTSSGSSGGTFGVPLHAAPDPELAK